MLLKNDGTLPFNKSIRKLALIGPWANATTVMQGNYFGVAPFLISPLLGAQRAGFEVVYAIGTNVTGNDTSGFAEALTAAKSADAIIFAGGLDETVEAESLDRLNVTWPGMQLDLVAELEKVGKPLVVTQFGGGQVDDTALKSNDRVRLSPLALYPRILTTSPGQRSRLGRLPWPERGRCAFRHPHRQSCARRPSSYHPVSRRLRHGDPDDGHVTPSA